MSEIKLLPCPFCGGDAEISSYETESLWSSEQVTYTKASCSECEIAFQTEPGHEPQSIAAWNRRAALSSAAVAEREPAYWAVHSKTGMHIGLWQHKSDADEALREYEGGTITALYLDPPPTSELEAENARLQAHLAEAMKAMEMFPELFLSFVGPANDEWFNRFADAVKNARRVREGGKVE